MGLIDADALLAAFEKDISEQTKHMELLKSVGDMKHYYDISKVQIGMVSCRRMLENAPIIIDAVPVKHAKLLDASPWGLCSECGFMMDYRDKFNYCPSCGARMDGEKNE